jgi:ankyrin repeat protein
VAKLINVDFAKTHAVNVNYQDSKGTSALHIACELQDEKLVNLLVKNFADVRCQNSKLQSPLHLVCANGNLPIFKLLVDTCYQALSCLDEQGKAPIDYA